MVRAAGLVIGHGSEKIIDSLFFGFKVQRPKTSYLQPDPHL